MNNLMHKLQNNLRRKARIRAGIVGTTERPRLTVSISNRHVSAQIIDDSAHKTLVYSTTVGQKISGTMTERAALVGADVAKKAKAVKIRRIVFDRNGDRKSVV